MFFEGRILVDLPYILPYSRAEHQFDQNVFNYIFKRQERAKQINLMSSSQMKGRSLT
jgi:hypothetical protein